MTRITLLFILSSTILFSCGTTQTRFTSYPKKIGYAKNEVVVFSPVNNYNENRSDQLLTWANEFVPTESKLKATPYCDADFNLKTHGLNLPKSLADTATLKALQNNTVVNFIVFNSLIKLNENYTNQLNNPNYNVREVSMNFSLYDIREQKTVWVCTTHLRVSPLNVKDGKENYSVNMSTGENAVAKAYRKTIKRLIKSLVINSEYKNPANP
jgi:hypothetical protein